MKILLATALLTLLAGCTDVPDVDSAKPATPYGAPMGGNLTAPTGHEPIVPEEDPNSGTNATAR